MALIRIYIHYTQKIWYEFYTWDSIAERFLLITFCWNIWLSLTQAFVITSLQFLFTFLVRLIIKLYKRGCLKICSISSIMAISNHSNEKLRHRILRLFIRDVHFLSYIVKCLRLINEEKYSARIYLSLLQSSYVHMCEEEKKWNEKMTSCLHDLSLLITFENWDEMKQDDSVIMASKR